MKHITLVQYLLVKFLQKLYSLLIKIHSPKILSKWIYHMHFYYMNYLLRPYYNKAVNKLNNHYFTGSINSNIIWMFWWQGHKNIPKIVYKCIRSVKIHSNHHKVIVLDKYNVRKYIDLPEILYKKVKIGKLSLAHLSDIIRFKLLYKYGGLWVDSTIFCTNDLNDKYFRYFYTTGGYSGTSPKFVKGRWAEFLIGGNKDNAALKFESIFLQTFYCINNLIPNYFLADYALNYSYVHNLGEYKNYINNFAKGNNPNLFVLADLLNMPYNLSKFKHITKNTNMFKLTYKMSFKRGNTFYMHLINNDF